MNKLPISFKLSFLLFIFFMSACDKSQQNDIISPDGTIKVSLLFNENKEPYCQISKNGMQVFNNIKLGILREDADFTKGLTQIFLSKGTLTDNYISIAGKQKEITYLANTGAYSLENEKGEKLDIVFRVSDDGVAFRYIFPEISEETKKIKDEITTFSFKEGTTSWIQPMSKAKSGWNMSNPSYEENYQIETQIKSLPKHNPGWIFPALFKSGDIWISITESAPDRNYCGCRLIHDSLSNEFKIGFSNPVEVFTGGISGPESKLPWNTPWRILTIDDKLNTIIESTLGTDLAKPEANYDFSFVKPGRSSWSWVLYKDDSTVYSAQKRFIDYSSDMGWEYCLIDADWDQKIGYKSLEELCEYAKSKNVGLLVWYNSAGDWNATPYTPRNKLLTKESRQEEFKKLSEIGIKGVKVDFFGGDGQSMIEYYQDIFEDAAKFRLMVNCHGSTLPRGWQRTYPNLVTMEAVKGFEFVTFYQETADLQPSHSTVIPFTRNLFDPMDFTPVCFTELSNLKRKTSNVFELALSVVFVSGIQHFAEVPEGMAKVPDDVKLFMKDVPVAWDETKFIDGYPGKYFVIARRKGKTFYMAGINGSKETRSVMPDLSFAGNVEQALFITDGKNDREFSISKQKLAGDRKIDMIPFGGFVYKVKVK